MRETWVGFLSWEDPPEKGTASPTPVFWPGDTVHGTAQSQTRLSDSLSIHTKEGASLVAQTVKNPPAMQETPVQFLG